MVITSSFKSTCPTPPLALASLLSIAMVVMAVSWIVKPSSPPRAGGYWMIVLSPSRLYGSKAGGVLTIRLLDSVRTHRQYEVERCSAGRAGRRPQAAAQRLDNRSVNCQPHSQSVGLGGVEGLEQLAFLIRLEPDTCILHRHTHSRPSVQVAS